MWEHKYHSLLFLSFPVLLFRHSSLHNLINRIQKATNTETSVCAEGGSPGGDNKDIENKTQSRDTHKRMCNLSYIPEPSIYVSPLFNTQAT